MEFVIELLKITIPAGLVLYAMYLSMTSFLEKELKQRQTDLQLKRTETNAKMSEQVLMIRLQAYERMVLFLERISPPQLISRITRPDITVSLLQQLLINDIRNEFAHNLSQQVYMSDDAWEMTKKATEEMILLINNSTLGLDENDNGLALSKRILENAMQLDVNPSKDAIAFIKEEMKQFF